MSVSIKIEHAVKRFGEKTIIPDLSLTIRQGEFFTLLGSSGCGKTTLLRMIAGFHTIEGGSFYFDDRSMNHVPSHMRNIGMVFQNYAIFPHMTAGKNVGYGLKQRKVKEPEYSKRVNDILDVVQIANLKDRLPMAMSGGQQQRIALARAIVIQPDVLLMDEPLSNLDAKLRVEMRLAIRRIQKQYGITTLYVTHDQDEALSMSDRIAVMNLGTIQQIGSPMDIYRHPYNLFVATFIGQSNVFECTGTETGIRFPEGTSFPCSRLDGRGAAGKNVRAVIRPSEFQILEHNGANEGILGVVEESSFLGSQMHYLIRLSFGQTVEISHDIRNRIYQQGESVNLRFDPEIINVFDGETGLSLMKDVKRDE